MTAANLVLMLRSLRSRILVVKLVAEGYSNKGISAILNVSRRSRSLSCVEFASCDASHTGLACSVFTMLR